MNIKEIKEILQLMQEHGLTEIELEKDGLKIKLKKTPSGKIGIEEGGEMQPMIVPMPVGAESAMSAAKPAHAGAMPAADTSLVKSPMVGTFYASPAPDQAPYVQIGQRVKEGDVLCIIEAMKLMNEIKCETSGTVIEMLVNNGQAVEFDQALFRIQK